MAKFSTAVLLVDPRRMPQDEPVLDDVGHGVPASESDDLARRLLSITAGEVTVTLIVEDELARRGDPHLEDALFIGERVLRWVEVDTEGLTGAELLRKGSSGYPLNAYMCQGSAADLGLAAAHELSQKVQDRLASSVFGVIVSVWDAEAFLAVMSPALNR